MLRSGNISDIDPEKGMARVKFLDDGIVSDWMQIIVAGALSTKFFHMFDINEQVACLMDENSEDGVILGALYNEKNTAGGDKDVVSVRFPDSSFIEYNRATHEYNINVSGKINIVSSGETIIESATVSIVADTANIEADSVNVDADTVIIDATAVNVTSENSTFTGNLVVTGSVAAASISAPVIAGPGVSMTGGNLTADGIISGADVKAGTVDLKTHVHAGVQTGGGSTSPPTP